MVIGILCESEDDFEVFSVLVRRSLESLSFAGDIKFIPYCAEGSILSKLEPASIKFFKKYLHGSEKVDMAIYFSDLDGSDVRKTEINRWVTAHKQLNPNRVIVTAFTEPHFEQWFMVEKDCLRQVLPGIPDVIPFSDCKPKEQLRKLILKFSPNLEVSSKETRKLIAEKVNLNSLGLRDADFKTFSNELRSAFREIENL